MFWPNGYQPGTIEVEAATTTGEDCFQSRGLDLETELII